MDKYRFEQVFSCLGTEWDLTESVFNRLEEFVCHLYGYRNEDVNQVRWMIFQQKHTKQNKVIHMAALPPCRQALKLHAGRSNYIARIWRLSLVNNTDAPSFMSHGRNDQGGIQLIGHAFPDDMSNIFFDPLFDENENESRSENESGSDDDF